MSFGPSLSGVDATLSAALTGLTARQRAIANNVANVDTPGYKATEVAFERQLRLALDRRQPIDLATTAPGHLSLRSGADLAATPQATTTGGILRNDGNNVDIDREMIKLADTSIKYNAVSQLVSARLSLFRTIVNEGRR